MSAVIPSTQRAAVKQGTGASGTAPIQQIPVQTPGPGQILVKIHWTGICGTDKSFIYDDWTAVGATMKPSALGVAGHEGAGTVAALPEEDPATHALWKVGDRVGVKWVASICGRCEFCTNGVDEVHCPEQKNSGFTCPGTFQEFVVTDARYATRLPDGVSDEEAGPLMCGGVTAYVACKRSAVRPGQWIVVLGAGGGLGHYGKAMGMRVIAVDGGSEKETMCKELGAEHYLDFTQEKDLAAAVTTITTYGAHGVIVFAATRAAYEVAPMMLRPGGTEVVVGFPSDFSIMAGAPPTIVGMRKLNIVGSVTGTQKDVAEALDFTARGIVKPRLTKGKLSDLDSFLKRIKEGTLAGRAVLQVADGGV